MSWVYIYLYIYIYFYCGRYKRNHMKSALNHHDMIIKPPNQTSLQPPFGGFQSMGVPPTTHRNFDRIFHERNHPAILKGYPPWLWKPSWNLDDFMGGHLSGGKSSLTHRQDRISRGLELKGHLRHVPVRCPSGLLGPFKRAWNSNSLWKKSYEILVETFHHGENWKGILLQ